MEKKRSVRWLYHWKDEVLALGFLMAFAFVINAGIQIKGLFMDDLYLWSCYGEQSFLEYVFPLGSTRFRFVYYLAAYVEMALVGTHITWFVPANIIINSLIAYTVFRFGRRLADNSFIGFLCGILYLLSRMSYYQISQVNGLLESLALWEAIGILYCLYRYLNEDRGAENCYLAGCGLYFMVCFTHERYMALLPLFLLAALMKLEKKIRNWLLPLGVFLAVLLIRLVTIGTLSPAGTGGTNVADTFQIRQAVEFVFHQILYLFGINMGDSYLSGLPWRESARWVKLVVAAADLTVFVLVLLFIVRVITDGKNRWACLRNCILFIAFIGACIVSSSVTIRVEVRWVYVSMTASWLFLAYMCGMISRPALRRKPGRQEMVPVLPDYRKRLLCVTLFLLYAALTFPMERYYRDKYPNLYYWHTQEQYNSLAEETWEKYGTDIFGKKIYILENTYEVSDFYADTFFKTFDRNRKAEGTEVIFVDSIRDFGQVTNNMLVIREDPKFHAYQDITEVVRQMKCQPVYGYYEDGWMDESARIRVMAGSTGVINLEIFYPGDITGTERSRITMDGRLVQELDIDRNIANVQIQAAPYDTVELGFENNFYLKDAQEQRGEKRFSMIVNITAD